MDNLATLQVYKELADWYERQGQAAMRDRFLILAAEAAFSAGNPDEAEHLRQRLLQGNPHHMLKPFSSFGQALQSTNVQIYIHDLQVNYPPQTAEGLLQDLRRGVSPTTAAAAGGEETQALTTPVSPVIEMHDDATLPLGTTAEPLKVYPLRDESEPLKETLKPKRANRPAAHKEQEPPPKPAQQQNRPAPRKPAPAPAVNPPPRPAPRPQPALPRAAAPVVDPAPSHESTAPAGAWLTLVLFGMTVMAGLLLAFYALARPFLPL